MKNEKPAYQRILLKLSGEALMGDDQFGINRNTIVRMVDEVVIFEEDTPEAVWERVERWRS